MDTSTFELFVTEQRRISKTKEWKSFAISFDRLVEAVHKIGLPFDPRFNAVHWAYDVSELLHEIAYSYCWMNTYASVYKEKHSRNGGFQHVDFHVSFYADNCMVRINSCRDKTALMIWAYYCPFNPEKRAEVLDYRQILDRLQFPAKYAISIRNQGAFVKHLADLQGSDFARVEKYRHLKIHRREPRIELYGVKSYHDWDYMLPLFNDKEIEQWTKQIEHRYPDPIFRNDLMRSCYIANVPFDIRQLDDRLWDFTEVQSIIQSCILKLLKSAASCYRSLLNRRPLRVKR